MLFVTYLEYSDKNDLGTLKGAGRKLEDYLQSLRKAHARIPGLMVLTSPDTARLIRQQPGFKDFPLEVVQIPTVNRDRDRFTRLLENGAKSMLSRRHASPEGEADYIALTGNKLHYLLAASALQPEHEELCWIDAGIFLPTHRHVHGDDVFTISSEPTGLPAVYASSFSFKDFLRPEGLRASILKGRSRAQLCGGSFIIRKDLALRTAEGAERYVDKSIERFNVIPTEQCTYLLALLDEGVRPSYLIRNYNGLYRAILSRPSRSLGDAMKARLLH